MSKTKHILLFKLGLGRQCVFGSLYSVPTYGVRVLGALWEERIGFNLRCLEHHVAIVAGAHLTTANDDVKKSSFVTSGFRIS
jgi:hypothetical protein